MRLANKLWALAALSLATSAGASQIYARQNSTDVKATLEAADNYYPSCPTVTTTKVQTSTKTQTTTKTTTAVSTSTKTTTKTATSTTTCTETETVQ
jgi:hypothetical protein